MAKSSITDALLQDALIERQMVERDALESLVKRQQADFETHQHKIAGTAYLIDLENSELRVIDHPTGTVKATYSLQTPQTPDYDVEDWDGWGTHALLAKTEDGNRLETFDRDLSEPYGLVSTDDRVYLYNEGRLNSEHLGQSRHALFAGVYKGKPESTPFDLYLSPTGKYLCVTDRGAGTVRILNTAAGELSDPVSIRSAGSSNTLNVAIDEAKTLAYITDNQSAGLFKLNLDTLNVERQRVGVGILGNLALAPTGEHIFLVSIKPNVGLHYVNTSTWEAEKDITLKGDLFKADSSDPCDLLSVSPGGEYVMIMTYLNSPEPFTPVISVIDARQIKTIRRYSLKDDTKPFQLAYGAVNEVKDYTLSLEDIVLKAELVGPQAMWSLKRELREQLGEDPDLEDAPEIATRSEESDDDIDDETDTISEDSEAGDDTEDDSEEPEFLEIEHQIIDIATSTVNNPEADTLNITPQKVNAIELPPAARDEIYDILLNTFQRQVDEDISTYEDVTQRLMDAAEKARVELENYDSTVVQLEDLFEGLGLKSVIVREAIVMMLELQESVQKEARVVPHKCPNCNQKLLGSWDCSVCGFELESPERAMKRRIASAEATANLPRGHMVIPDPQGLRLLQLNPYKYVSWNLDPDQLSCDYPVDSLWMPNDNVMVVDKDANQILEVGLRGKIHWRFDTHASPAHALNEPVKFTYYFPQDSAERHFLIVDQGNHRVLETNQQNEIVKEFGVQGVSGSEGSNLSSPSDVQFTHDETYLIADTGNNRVIEYKNDGGILQVFGEKLGLKAPTAAMRLFSDHTLILDAGNYRLLQLDSVGEIVHECTYYTPDLSSDYRVVSPIKMIRMINKDILIMDEDKILQIMLSAQKLVWHSKIEDLAFQPKVDAPEVVVDENGNERLVYKVVDHGEMRPVRLAQKINFKRMQKLIEARLKGERIEEKDADGKSINAADKLRALIEDRKLESKRTLRRELTLDTFQPSEIFQEEALDLKGIRHYAVDKHHNAIIRINRKGEVKWHYGFEMGQTLSRPYHVSETRRTLLVADTGNNRVVEISKTDKDVVADIKGAADSPLGGPRAAQRLNFGRTLIADQRNKRLVEVNSRGEITWEFKKTGQISSPQYVEELENGHILFADSMLNSIREVDRDGNLCWSYGSRMKGTGPGQLFAPEFATRLANGNTLIADTRNHRIIEVTMEGREVWLYEGNKTLRQKILNPTRAQRFENGHTFITYNNGRELAEIGPEDKRVWYFKMGNDVFLPPISSDQRGQKQMIEKVTPYYNPIEKRLIRSAEEKAMWGMEAHVTLMENCMMKSVRASLVLMLLEQSGTVVKTFPSPEEILADKFGKEIIISFIMDPGQDAENVAEDLRYIAEVQQAQMERIVFEEVTA